MSGWYAFGNWIQFFKICQLRELRGSWELLCILRFYYANMVSVSFTGSIVSVGDPKKKYTRFEKIGQGLVGAFCFLGEIS